MNKQKNKKKVIAFLLSMLMLISLFQNISYTPIAEGGETESVASESDANFATGQQSLGTQENQNGVPLEEENLNETSQNVADDSVDLSLWNNAERAAFASLTEDATGAEMYVTLEPCCHYGKQPPCTLAIVEHGIKKVYVGSDDPNDKVAGKGIAFLREHGVEVETGVMKDACDAINPVFFHYITTKLPYVVMKYAMSMDGKIAAYTGKSQWITGEAARQHVQETRNWLKGIMVGCNTVLQDDPALTCRIEGGRNPVRIVCDSHLRIPLDCRLVQTAVDVPTIVATLDGASDKAKELQQANVQILQCKEKDGRIDLYDLMVQLGAQDIDGILLEGGGTLNEQALAQDIVQEVQVYIAPKIIGGAEAKTPVEGKGVPDPNGAYRFAFDRMEQVGDDILLRYRKEKREICLQES